MKNIFKNRIYSLKDQNKILKRTIVLAGFVSIIFYLILLLFSPEKSFPYSNEMLNAAQIMEETISVIRDYSDEHGIEIDEVIDPNRTGLIGPEFSQLTTTIGHLDAKRTTTNPDMAGLIVHLLHQVNVESGDTIAIGSSASFPALMVASLAAAKAMNVYPKTIISLGASSFGATKTDLNLLDIYDLLLDKDIINIKPIAISLGGDKDVGETYDLDFKNRLFAQIQDGKIPFLQEPNLVKNTIKRMKIFNGDSFDKPVSAFINCGGSYANLGTSSLVLKLLPGLNGDFEIPSQEERGVIFEMAVQNIPIIHLLYIKGLVLKFGLPWDPIPLHKPGDAGLYNSRTFNTIQFWIIFLTYLSVLALLILFHLKKKASLQETKVIT